MKNWGPNAKALILYQSIKRLQKTMLNNLKKQGAFIKFEKDLAILLKKEKLDPETFEALKVFMGKERPMTIIEQIERAAEKAIEKNSQLIQRVQANSIPLTLTIDGDLYYGPKEKFCYPMRGQGLRLKILRAMIGYPTFRRTREIMEDVSSTSAVSFRDAVGAINHKARTALNLPAGKNNDLILSKSHSGYMINPLYPITLER
ncbi:MAG: hypothetical protein NTX96_03460 [Candidatus Zambryskibacteria bacterium]|nr:hypothetical protein [Candidatus Zambryskibacteria bacterium]